MQLSCSAIALTAVLTCCQRYSLSGVVHKGENLHRKNGAALRDCIAIALQNQPAIEIQRETAHVAGEQVDIVKSNFLPQIDFAVRYTAIDEPRSVDIDGVFDGQVGDVFSDAAAFFGIARAAGSAAANFALDNPHVPIFPGGPSFDSAKQASLAGLPATINVPLLGQNFLQTQIQLVQPLWTGGKISSRYQQARLGAQVANLGVARARQLTQFNVVRGYLAILLAARVALRLS